MFSNASWAASPPTEFVNIPWDATPSEAKHTMGKREGVTVKEETPEHIVFQGGIFATHPVEHWELEFINGKFWRGTVYIVIPPGNAKDGAPIRNHQFEDYYKSLHEKYGKGIRFGDGSHTQGTWLWTVPSFHIGDKDTISILLSYSWEPYFFKVQYSRQQHTSSTGKPVKKGDL